MTKRKGVINHVPTIKDRFAAILEEALGRHLPPESTDPPQIHQAMRYAVLNGGKRFRPLLVLAACEAVGGKPPEALLPACAVEFVHCYSLVHDDLPALDNDEIRRGLPTCHKKFGEAIAILAGDALLTRAFELLGQVRPPERAVRLLQELTQAAGTEGMIGGQVVDLHFLRKGVKAPDLETLDFISCRKTGCLIQTSATLGALVGTNASQKLSQIRRFGTFLGLAFQVVDDIMDGNGYLRRMDFEEARKKAQDLIQKAKQEAGSFGVKAGRLLGLADFLLERIPNATNVPVDLKD